MSILKFYKYQGTGNDFVMIDDREKKFDETDHKLVARLCHRKFGIGADGLILIRNTKEAEFEMVYFNSDGHVASLCGNGSRCAVSFAHFLGIVGEETQFLTTEGVLKARVSNEYVNLKMPNVTNISRKDGDFFVNTGSPHHVQYVDDVEKFEVFDAGRQIRYSEKYAPAGTNVNFIQRLANNELFVRTYERGVENETLSCGTGVTACALVYSMNEGNSPVSIKTLGGALEVSFEKHPDGSFTDIYLSGPANQVFKGEITL